MSEVPLYLRGVAGEFSWREELSRSRKIPSPRLPLFHRRVSNGAAVLARAVMLARIAPSAGVSCRLPGRVY